MTKKEANQFDGSGVVPQGAKPCGHAAAPGRLQGVHSMMACIKRWLWAFRKVNREADLFRARKADIMRRLA